MKCLAAAVSLALVPSQCFSLGRARSFKSPQKWSDQIFQVERAIKGLPGEAVPVGEWSQKVDAERVEIARKGSRSLVKITAVGASEANKRSAQDIGSGVIADPEGLVVTNAHVVREKSEFEVLVLNNDGFYENVPYEIVAIDDNIDLAILKLVPEQANRTWPAVTFGDSELVKQGHSVYLLGNPLDFDDSFSVGVISSIQRSDSVDSKKSKAPFFQVDAAMNPGSSGGPAFNYKGELIGVQTFIYASASGGSTGLGFFIPSDVVKNALSSYKRFGEIVSAWVGLEFQSVSVENSPIEFPFPLRGAKVVGVVPGSPAQEAGIRVGDILVRADGKYLSAINPSKDAADNFALHVRTKAIGDEVTLLFLREGEVYDAVVKLGFRLSEPGLLNEEPETSE